MFYLPGRLKAERGRDSFPQISKTRHEIRPCCCFGLCLPSPSRAASAIGLVQVLVTITGLIVYIYYIDILDRLYLQSTLKSQHWTLQTRFHSAGKAPASTTSKSPTKLTKGAKAAKKTPKAAAPADGENKWKKGQKESYSSYIYKGMCLTQYTSQTNSSNRSTLTLVSPTGWWLSTTASWTISSKLTPQTGPPWHWYLQQSNGHPSFVNDIFEHIALLLVGSSYDHILYFCLPANWLSSWLSALVHEWPHLRKMSRSVQSYTESVFHWSCHLQPHPCLRALPRFSRVL